MKRGVPKIAEFLLRIFSESKNRNSVLGDYEEEFNEILNLHGEKKACNWYRRQVFNSILPLLKNKSLLGGVMFKNYINIAVRVLKKQKIYSAINLFGLSIGIACCLLIYVYVSHEINYDDYHKDTERIYTVLQDIKNESSTRFYSIISARVAPALLENFPEIEYAGRIRKNSEMLVKNNEKSFFETDFCYIDQELLNILHFEILEGGQENCLTNPYTMIITKSAAAKYFGNDNPVGKSLNVNGNDYLITALISDPPTNTHLKYSFLASFKTVENEYWANNWLGSEVATYIKIKEGIAIEAISKKISNIADQYVGERIKHYNQEYIYSIMPVQKINLDSKYFANRDVASLFIYSVIGFIILVIAVLNFINLFTARSTLRAKEVGLRKVAGADHKQIIHQFLIESVFLTFIAFIGGILISLFFIKDFNRIIGTEFTYTSFYQPEIVIGIILLFFAVSLSVGIYPMIVYSKFNPVQVLKSDRVFNSSRSVLRNVLIIIQFSLTVFLIITTIVASRQIEFMKNADLGFEKEQKIIIPAGRGLDITKQYELIKEEFGKINGVKSISASGSLPGYRGYRYNITLVNSETKGSSIIKHIHIDEDYISLYGIKLLAGRNFSDNFGTDETSTALINKSALKTFGWSNPDEAIGQIIKTGLGSRELKIIGVTDDYNHNGLQNVIPPLVFDYLPRMFYYLTISVYEANLQETVSAIENQWNRLSPGIPFEYKYLSEEFNSQYKSEEALTELLDWLTFIGILVASLGLLGFITFYTERRIREIGIRKVLGASIFQIQKLLVKDIIKWIIIANLIAWPITFYLVNKGLHQFAYRIELGFVPFIAAGGMVLIISLITISYQIVKAAINNPIKSLKHE